MPADTRMVGTRLRAMENPFIAVAVDQTFRFDCSPNVPCFNACCRDLNQFLTPYDILRLKAHLGISSSELLETYASLHTGPETGLPVVTLKPQAGTERRCPFVAAAGCRVYADRPSSCRMYPLARAVRRDRATGRTTEHFALIREPHCRGFQQTCHQTARRWMASQAVDAYNEHNDRFLDILRLKNRGRPGPLDLRSSRLFQIALYDVDRFREHICRRGLADDWPLSAEDWKALKTDDLALLELGYGYVKREVFGSDDR
jgi:Fe-S-cluster containining protein